MTDAKHTPGPWTAPTEAASRHGFPRWDFLAKDGDCVVSVLRVLHYDGMAPGERDANVAFVKAALKAQAVNAELVAALESITQIQRDKCVHADADTLYMLLDQKVTIAERALARAKEAK